MSFFDGSGVAYSYESTAPTPLLPSSDRSNNPPRINRLRPWPTLDLASVHALIWISFPHSLSHISSSAPHHSVIHSLPLSGQMLLNPLVSSCCCKRIHLSALLFVCHWGTAGQGANGGRTPGSARCIHCGRRRGVMWEMLGLRESHDKQSTFFCWLRKVKRTLSWFSMKGSW